MVNAAGFRPRCSVVLLAALVLIAAAWLRSAEYDEQYTLFLTAGMARPDWPKTVFTAGTVVAAQSGHATLAAIAHDLRATDVHPPLYFWAMSIWRAIFGPGLFGARMLSVLCGVASVALVGVIARRCAIAPVPAMLLTLGCYGFVYTNAIARGFAPTQTLTLCAVALLLGRRGLLVRRALLAGACLGAACGCNYLAVFIAATAIAAAGAWAAVLPAVPFLAVDGWFFAAQHGARTGQFPPFEIGPGLFRLGEYLVASVFGGLPFYVDGIGRILVGAAVVLGSVMLVVCVGGARPLSAGPAIRVLLGAAMATPVGLLLLGAVFDNTPIELRYLSFGLPFIALLVAWALSRRHLGFGRTMLVMTLTIQFAGVTGLLFSPRSTQPARAIATAAARLVDDGVVLLPRGNDGVGIVGAFGIEAPASLPILLISPTETLLRIAPYHRVVLARMAQDADSIASIAALRAILVAPVWRRVAIGSNVEVYERTAEGE